MSLTWSLLKRKFSREEEKRFFMEERISRISSAFSGSSYFGGSCFLCFKFWKFFRNYSLGLKQNFFWANGCKYYWVGGGGGKVYWIENFVASLC